MVRRKKTETAAKVAARDIHVRAGSAEYAWKKGQPIGDVPEKIRLLIKDHIEEGAEQHAEQADQ